MHRVVLFAHVKIFSCLTYGGFVCFKSGILAMSSGFLSSAITSFMWLIYLMTVETKISGHWTNLCIFMLNTTVLFEICIQNESVVHICLFNVKHTSSTRRSSGVRTY